MFCTSSVKSGYDKGILFSLSPLLLRSKSDDSERTFLAVEVVAGVVSARGPLQHNEALFNIALCSARRAKVWGVLPVVCRYRERKKQK
jgi:hypothetical protein